MSALEVVDLGVPEPYKQYALEYWARGWIPLPLPPGEKSPPPVKTTGHHPTPSVEMIEEWIATIDDRSNIGLRIPDGVIGIDVDAYAGKQGGATLAAATNKWGDLPDTWALSARNDGISGIRFYQIPTGRAWPGEVGPDIQVIQYRHRYAVAYPSKHPKLKKMYRWYPPGSQIDGRSYSDEIPDISDLTVLE